MNEYLDPAYTVPDLWAELRLRSADASDTLDEIAFYEAADGPTITFTASAITDAVPVAPLLDHARTLYADAINDVSAIRWAIWQRTHGTSPLDDPELFAIMFGERP